MSVPTVVGLISTPFLSHLADQAASRENVVVLIQVATTLSFLVNLFALPFVNDPSSGTAFVVFFSASALVGLFSTPVYSILSGISISQLRWVYGVDGHIYFGRERLWGAVSFAAGNLFLGALLDITFSGILIIYVLFTLTSLCFIYVVLRFKALNTDTGSMTASEASCDHISSRLESIGTTDNPPASHDCTTLTLIQALRPVLCTGGLQNALFFNLMFWLSVGMGAVESLIFLYFRDDLHASYTLCGLTVVITVLFEIPLFALAPTMLRRLGYYQLSIIGASGYIFRALGYSLVPSAWYVCLLEPMHGLTYALVHSASVSYVSDRMSGDYESTAQAVLSILDALGRSVGSIVGGYIIQTAGSRCLYRILGLLVFLATVVFVIAGRQRPVKPEISATETPSALTSLLTESQSILVLREPF